MSVACFGGCNEPEKLKRDFEMRAKLNVHFEATKIPLNYARCLMEFLNTK